MFDDRFDQSANKKTRVTEVVHACWRLQIGELRNGGLSLDMQMGSLSHAIVATIQQMQLSR